MTGLRSFIIEILLLLCIGGIAKVLTLVGVPLHHLLLAILIGIVFVNTVGLPDHAKGDRDVHKLLLEVGIVLMGARFQVGQLLDVGLSLLILVPLFVGFTVLFVELLSYGVFPVDRKLGSLLAAGSSICGVSAIVAVAGSIRPDEDAIAFAVATILLFDAVTLFLYPVLGVTLGLSDRVFGIWAGISMFSTGPVAAAGFTVSDIAGRWAIITKVTRNLFISVLALLYATRYSTKSESDSQMGQEETLWNQFPKFIIGFLGMVALASVGAFDDSTTATIVNAYQWLFLFAFAGLGLEIKISDMRKTGIQPILITLVTLITLGSLSLLTIQFIFG